ncbi:MAG: co-chaperone DjlA [Gammaproteobacteria bacterium]|nr:co-chaperone DjlA [Gammaproteobacteria bacterium]
MNWWGKLMGASFGYMLGGPLGVILGIALGHQLDKAFGNIMLDPNFGSGKVERVQQAFFTATFSVMGHLAKADGRVSSDEIALARHVMAQMQLDEQQKQVAINLFNEGKQADFELDAALKQFRVECHRRHNLIHMFLEILISTAIADGEIDETEHQLLVHISAVMGVSAGAFEQLLRMVGAQQAYQQQGHSPVNRLQEAYDILGVEKAASDAEIKKAYRRLMNQHHPDKLVAKGLPEEMMKIATEKTQEIKQAYEHIKESRK